MTDERAAIHSELKQLADESRLTPQAVVEQARNPTSILHAFFQWDDQKAAQQHRLDQARRLISSFEIVVISHRKEYRVQEFVEDPRKERQQGYVAITSIVDDKQVARNFIERELAVAATYVEKCTTYAELVGLRKQVEGLRQDIEGLRADVRGEAAAVA